MENKNILTWVLGIAVLLLVFLWYSMVGYGGTGYGFGGMRGMMYGAYGSGMMFFGWLYGFLVLVTLILLIIWLLQKIQNQNYRRF